MSFYAATDRVLRISMLRRNKAPSWASLAASEATREKSAHTWRTRRRFRDHAAETSAQNRENLLAQKFFSQRNKHLPQGPAYALA